MPPPVQLFLTTIASQPKLRQRQEYILRILQVKKLPYLSYDLASDEGAKRLWKRKAPPGKQELPGILVGGRFAGTFEQFEEAVEYNELDIFLRRNEKWDEDVEGKALETSVIGVPGVVTPEKITGQRPSFAPAGSKPAPAVREGEMDLGDHLEGYGLQGVKVTPDEITDLVKMLGLDDAESNDLISGLDFSASPKPTEPSATQSKSPPPKPVVDVAEQGPDPQEGGSGDDSGLDEPPDPGVPRVIRKRTDKPPLQSPITPSSSKSSYINVAEKKGSIPSPKNS